MIFKTVLLLLCIVLVFPFSNPLCGGKRYKCGLENQANVCVNVSEYRGKVHELSPCAEGQECLWQSALFEKPVYCTAKPAAELILPGEGCTSNSDCKSNQCTKSVCVGKKTGQKCVDHTECDVGYYCDEFCLEQLQFENVCSDDYQCENNCVCNLGKCAFYYSLENGIYADNSMACLNGYVHQNGTCQVGPHSQIKGRPCATNDECLLLDIDSKLSGYSECQCGFNAGGYSYCSLAEGDEEYYEMIKLFQWLLQIWTMQSTIFR